MKPVDEHAMGSTTPSDTAATLSNILFARLVAIAARVDANSAKIGA